VALNAETGKLEWRKIVEIEKNFFVLYLFHANGKLILGHSSVPNETNNLSAFDPKTGQRLWRFSAKWVKNNHGKHMLRAVHSNGKLYFPPYVIDLNNGKTISKKIPAWLGGCGTCGTNGDLLFGGYFVYLYDLSKHRKTKWNNLRSSCWLSVIAGGKMILAPEGGGGCSCGNLLETSVGFKPKILDR
jgi:outer membrane protein assembly factor BamB